MNIGPHILSNPFFLAPMAGLTDGPLRQLCKKLGAGYAVSEMVGSQPGTRTTPKTSHRINQTGETGLIAVQIVGAEPLLMGQAAARNIDHGAQIIDINMGCPVKKVCNKWAGSALMQDETLALNIIEAVVAVCAPRGVPVTLKMRTGWSESHKNAVSLAGAAERAGVQMITVHGRTRQQGYGGQAEYDTIAAVKAAVAVPVVANGDIDTPEKARHVFAVTKADAVMIGRAAMGRPWIFRELAHFMTHRTHLAPPLVAEIKQLILHHLQDHYALYGEFLGVRTARKHIGWYVKTLPGGLAFRERMNLIDDCAQQTSAVADYFDGLNQQMDRLPGVVVNGLTDENKEHRETTV